MASRNATIAEAVKTLLNTAAAIDLEGDPAPDPANPFRVNFTAKRTYAPTEMKEDAKGWVVDIWTPGDIREQAARGAADYEMIVAVALQKNLPKGCDPSKEEGNTVLDAMTEVAERVALFLGPDIGGEDGLGGEEIGAKWRNTETTLPNPDVLRETRQFLAVVKLTLFSLQRT
jgi:hypothetical protein